MIGEETADSVMRLIAERIKAEIVIQQ
jgi:hypothetical protein